MSLSWNRLCPWCVCSPLRAIAVITFVLAPASLLHAQTVNVTASWNPNPESNIAGYRLSYGIVSGQYTTTIDVGIATSRQVALSPGVRYYFGVQAYNTSGLVSPFSAEASIDLSVVNQPPALAQPANQSHAENASVSLQLSGSDPDGNPLSYSASGMPAGPTLNSTTGLISGVLSYTSAGTHTVIATVSDGSLSASRTFTWTVTNVNRTPTLTAVANQTHAENAAVSLQLAGSDPDGTAVTYSATGLPPSLTVNATSGLVSGTLSYSSAGTHSVTATVSDGTLTASRTFTWTVTNVNRAPTLTAVANQTHAENAVVSLQLAGSDPDSTAVTYSATGLPPSLAVNASSGLVSGTLSYSSAGTHSVTTTVSDGTLTASRTFTWTVTNVNRAPTLTAVANQTHAENAVVSLQLAGSDPDATALTYSATGLPPSLAVNASSGLVSGTLSPSSAGTHSVTATVSDGTLTASRSFTWTVTNVNQAPTLTAVANQTHAENAAVSLQLAGSDPDGTALSYSVTGLPPSLAVNASSGLLSGTLSYASAGTHSVTATVSDGTLTASRTFTWTVTNVNQAPTLTAVANQTHAENAAVSLQLAGSDPDGTALTYSVTGLPPSLAVNASSGLVSGALSSSSIGSHAVTATVSDGDLTTSQSFTWTVRRGAPETSRASDFDGDGRTDIALYRGSGRWSILQSGSGNALREISYGLYSDLPVPGDYDGDGRTDVAIFRPSTGTWHILESSSNFVTAVSYVLGTGADRPAPGDYDGDGRTDPAVFRPASGSFDILQSSSNYSSTTVTLGAAADRPVPGDYDGDGRTDVAVYQPTGLWSILLSGTNNATTLNIPWGLRTDRPVPGDYDGDGETDIAIVRPSTGTWYILQSSTGFTESTSYVLGISSDRPVPGDYDGDGRTDLATYRPSTGQWTILHAASNYTTPTLVTLAGANIDRAVPNIVVANGVAIGADRSDAARAGDFDGDGRADLTLYSPATGSWSVLASSTNYSTPTVVSHGSSGDRPVPGAYDTDGRADVAVFGPAGLWSALSSSTSYTAGISIGWGLATDMPVPADYDGDGGTDVAVFRPSTSTWYILQSGTGYTMFVTQVFGGSSDRPVPADYDGDGKTDLAVYSPSGLWSILLSSTNQTTTLQGAWGLGTDIPVPGDYDGDGMSDITVYRPSTGTWYVLQSSTNFTGSFTVDNGGATDIPVAGDYDGDGRTDMAVFQPSTAGWFVRLSSTNYTTSIAVAAGAAGDIPVPVHPK